MDVAEQIVAVFVLPVAYMDRYGSLNVLFPTDLKKRRSNGRIIFKKNTMLTLEDQTAIVYSRTISPFGLQLVV